MNFGWVDMVSGYKLILDDMSINFDKGKWELDKWHKFWDELVMGSKGFHACTNPLTTLSYCTTMPLNVRLFEIEAGGEILYEGDVFVSSEMRIVRELDTFQFSKEIIDFIAMEYGDSGYNSINTRREIDGYIQKLWCYIISNTSYDISKKIEERVNKKIMDILLK